jgi:hypothetical protein
MFLQANGELVYEKRMSLKAMDLLKEREWECVPYNTHDCLVGCMIQSVITALGFKSHAPLICFMMVILSGLRSVQGYITLLKIF